MLGVLFVFLGLIAINAEVEHDLEDQYNAVLVSGHWQHGVDEGCTVYDDNIGKNSTMRLLSKDELLRIVEAGQLFYWVNRSFFAKVVFVRATVFDPDHLISSNERRELLGLAQKNKSKL